MPNLNFKEHSHEDRQIRAGRAQRAFRKRNSAFRFNGIRRLVFRFIRNHCGGDEHTHEFYSQ